jgi:hypothetical protein
VGVRGERAAYLAIAASLVLVALSRMTWVHLTCVDGFIPCGPGTLSASRVHGIISDSDGNSVLILAAVSIVASIVSLSGPPIRRLSGAAVALAGSLIALMAATDAVHVWSGAINDYTGDFQVAPALVLTVVGGLATAGLGLKIALTPDGTVSEVIAKDGVEGWA